MLDGTSDPTNNMITVKDRSAKLQILLVSAGKKAIHLRRRTGEKAIRFADENGNFDNSEHALVGDDVKILGSSEFVTLDIPLPVSATQHVIITDAPLEVLQRQGQSDQPMKVEVAGCFSDF